MKVFSNAPLPSEYENEAVFSPDGSEFALRPETSKLYLRWCTENNIDILGFDIWLDGPTDHTQLDDYSTKGDATHCLKEMDCVLNHPQILKFNRAVLFNIWANFISQ